MSSVGCSAGRKEPLGSRLRRAVCRGLPTGRSLPFENWTRRHRRICVLLWLHVLVIPVVGLVSGEALSHAVLEAAPVAVLAAAAGYRPLGRIGRSSMATIGLISSSAVLTHLADGLIEMHFHFFIMVVIVSLYQSWVPFLLALGLVVLHHGLAGAGQFPMTVFNHPAALANPWIWALLHGFFILGQSAACLVAWRVNEDALEASAARREERSTRPTWI